ncbi:LuxR C-terminal-related transcriptional regulator [Sunxiuqinia sp. A32]|uniref:LuxR C-terminal-related transcriptional regulator n=1 Tax=Sunxiuqinia sp. A32 TaxID=3461496 RepID=UPI0040451DCF
MRFTLFVITFAVSVGLSTLGIMSAYRLKKQSNPYASSLFYMDTFLTAFGFYGIWGYLIFRFLFENIEIAEYLFPNLLGIFPILGMPLLIVAWYLLLQFCLELIGMKISPRAAIIYFFFLLISFFILGIHFKNQITAQAAIDLILMFRLIIIFNLSFLLLGGIFLLLKRRKATTDQSLLVIWNSLFIPCLLLSISLFMISSHWFVVVLFILFYFSSIAILPTFLLFKSTENFIVVSDFESFCLKYEISKREVEIIQEIRKGKTNKEIAESLFITLQTVKDHTHRIYTKTNVSNRVQLTNLVNESVKSSS